MKKYDLHTHTHFSKCSNLKPATLLRLAKEKGLNGIAVTDHHCVAGGKAVQKINKDKNFEVIVGSEISTSAGDILAYYLKEDIKSTDFDCVVDEVRKQNGLIIIPHPFRTSTNPNHQFKIPLEKIKNKVDAIECFNARMLFNSNNEKADRMATKLGMAKTAGSDGHFSFEVGNGYTMFEGSLRDALKKKTTKIGGKIRFGAFGGFCSFIKKRLP